MRILIIEDDEKLSALMKYHLEKEDFTVDYCYDGKDGLRWAKEQVYDLILLDRMLPSCNGIEVLKSLRDSNIPTPVLMLTALGSLNQKIEGLDAGADDYLVKPFEIEELSARIRAIIRRPTPWNNQDEITYADLSFNLTEKKISTKEKSCSLSKREAELLEFLLKNQGQVLPRNVLFSRVWGPDAGIEDGSLDTYIYFLRNHLKSIGSNAKIQVVRGIGYSMKKEPADAS